MPELSTQSMNALSSEIKAMGGRVETRLNSLQKQVDAIDAAGATRHASDSFTKSLEDRLKESDQVAQLIRDHKGRAVLNFTGAEVAELLDRKSTITIGAVGTATSGVLQIERLPGITPEARQQLTIRDLLSSRPTTFQVIDFVKVATPMTIASPVAETSLKPENAVTFTTVSERVKTIATWIPMSKQVIDDFSELAGFIRTTMPYYVNLEEELQLLSGDGTGENLHGLIPQATAFSTGLLSATKGWNKIDILGRAIQQATAAKELPPTFVTLHPNDWWDIRLTKDQFGRYILGDPQNGSLTINQFGSTAPVQNALKIAV